MKFLVLLTIVASTSCNRYGSGGSPTGPHNPLPPGCKQTSQNVDFILNGSEYHYSWCHDGNQIYSHSEANQYCARLGTGWQGVSIGSIAEDQFISSVIGSHALKYIWTSGTKTYSGWRWQSGEPFLFLNWSSTGADGNPQPDNREGNNEACHAVLNNFYNDGIKWHDIACHHNKPIICERASGSGYQG
ncbi:lithostathine-like [Penaeus japonicus]|uniref:lithostathine-like n=1 Tax=Penaeus japonicus TaxID=27405 RepID=UPI001C7109F5|nr:lithostathine-like [Penaeus japonicus]XP_042889214.1 lithostathine-like [Penaeus japonicus]